MSEHSSASMGGTKGRLMRRERHMFRCIQGLRMTVQRIRAKISVPFVLLIGSRELGAETGCGGEGVGKGGEGASLKDQSMWLQRNTGPCGTVSHLVSSPLLFLTH